VIEAKTCKNELFARAFATSALRESPTIKPTTTVSVASRCNNSLIFWPIVPKVGESRLKSSICVSSSSTRTTTGAEALREVSMKLNEKRKEWNEEDVDGKRLV